MGVGSEESNVAKFDVWLKRLVFFKVHFLAFFGLEVGLPAFDMAIATACFWGLPAVISVLMLVLITFGDFPYLSGIAIYSFAKV